MTPGDRKDRPGTPERVSRLLHPARGDGGAGEARSRRRLTARGMSPSSAGDPKRGAPCRGSAWPHASTGPIRRFCFRVKAEVRPTPAARRLRGPLLLGRRPRRGSLVVLGRSRHERRRHQHGRYCHGPSRCDGPGRGSCLRPRGSPSLPCACRPTLQETPHVVGQRVQPVMGLRRGVGKDAHGIGIEDRAIGPISRRPAFVETLQGIQVLLRHRLLRQPRGFEGLVSVQEHGPGNDLAFRQLPHMEHPLSDLVTR